MGFHNLSNELLVQIMGHVSSLPALLNLIRAYPFLGSVYETSYWGILPNVFATSGMPLQLQKLVSTSMFASYGLSVAIRDAMKTSAGPAHLRTRDSFGKRITISSLCSARPVVMQDYLGSHLEGEETPPVIGEDPHPIASLKQVAQVCLDIDICVESFCKCCLRRPGPVSSEISNAPCEPEPSATELHRIRRALWRLHLWSNMMHGDPADYAEADFIRLMKDGNFLSRILCAWEVEEMECLQVHLLDMKETLRHGSPLDVATSHHLLERYDLPRIVSVDDERRDPIENTFLHRCAPFRGDLVRDSQYLENFTHWSDTPDANAENAGSEYLWEYGDAIGDNELVLTFRSEPLTRFLRWGYCIWDKSRLERWGVLDHEASVGRDRLVELWWDKEDESVDLRDFLPSDIFSSIYPFRSSD